MLNARIALRRSFTAATLITVCLSQATLAEDFLVPDDLPEYVQATMQARDRILASLPQDDSPGLEFFVADLQKWSTASPVTVAFLGGTTDLHRDIAQATAQITDNCAIRLDFGFDSATGQYRTWSESDTTYSADIRVSFDQRGYFSLVGTDSKNPHIGLAGRPVGGRPNQRSLNLDRFDFARPSDWRRTVRHEFLHAIAFNHEHQSSMGGCDAQFRWEDDPGYVPTQNADDVFVNDSLGRRPGIYTYLSGAPNGWNRQKVDYNMRQAHSDAGSSGPFDRASIMLYRFPSWFYVMTPSPCAPIGNSEDLSEGDIAGLKFLYPNDSESVATPPTRSTRIEESQPKSRLVGESLKSFYSK